MNFEKHQMLSQVRLEHAKECLHAVKELYKCKNYKSAVNRAYYAVFHAMRSVLAFDEIDMKHHSGVIAEFRRLYIKTQKIDKRFSEIISLLFDIRTDSDYDDFFSIEKEEANEQIKNAELFLEQIEAFLQDK